MVSSGWSDQRASRDLELMRFSAWVIFSGI